MRLCALRFCLAAVLFVFPAWGQSAIPLPVLYRAFFDSVTNYDSAAQAVEAQGKNGSELREHFSRPIGLTKAQNDQLFRTATQFRTAVQVIDRRAEAVINSARARIPNGRAKSVADIPPLPPELQEMSAERDTLVLSYAAALKSNIGDAAAAQVERFLQGQFSKNFTPLGVTPRTPQTQPQTTLSHQPQMGGNQ